MEITNMSGYTYRFYGSFEGISDFDIKINFICNNVKYTRMLYSPSDGLLYFDEASNIKQVYSTLDGVNEWVDTIYNEITVIDGEDVSNATAIETLQSIGEFSESSSDEPDTPTTPDEPDTPSEELEYKTIGELLTGIGNAIRTKKGTTDKINAQKMPSEVLSIKSGGSGGSVTASVKANSLTITNATVSVVEDNTIELEV